jgi:hypothetical protein
MTSVGRADQRRAVEGFLTRARARTDQPADELDDAGADDNRDG